MIEVKIKELLKKYPTTCRDIIEFEKEVEMYHDKIKHTRELSGISYEGVSVQTSNISDTTAQAVITIEQFGVEIERDKDRLKRLYDQRYIVTELLMTLTADQRRLVELRYFKRQPWRYVAMMVNLSRNQSMRNCDKAIASMVWTVTVNDDLMDRLLR